MQSDGFVKEFMDVKTMHMHWVYKCCQCGKSIHSEGIPNNYYFPQWFLYKPMFPTEDGLLCSACRAGGGNHVNMSE